MLKLSQLESALDFQEAMRNPNLSGGKLIKKLPPFPQWLADELTRPTNTPVNIKLERKLLATRDGRTSGDFNTLLEATEWAPILPFDHFVKKMQWIVDDKPEGK